MDLGDFLKMRIKGQEQEAVEPIQAVEPTQPDGKAPINPKAIYTLAEVSEYLGLSRPVIYELIEFGSLYMPPVNGKSRGKRFITGENIRRFAMGRPQEKE